MKLLLDVPSPQGLENVYPVVTVVTSDATCRQMGTRT